jgi:hypothetical protein
VGRIGVQMEGYIMDMPEITRLSKGGCFDLEAIYFYLIDKYSKCLIGYSGLNRALVQVVKLKGRA